MATPLFTLSCDKLSNATLVGFRGKEQISRPYEFEVFFTVPAGTAVRPAVGERATLKGARTSDGEPFAIHGVIAGVKLLLQMPDGALYGALVVPRLWLLRHFARSYVFTFKKLKDFLSETLEAGGLTSSDYRFQIDEGARDEEEFVAQYRESYLDFFHRWLEREGLYYYFEHDPDGASEVLVIVDDKSHMTDFPGGGRVRYYPRLGDDGSAGEALHHLEADTRWLPKSVTVADYDYANPSMLLSSDSAVTDKGIGTIVEYGYRAFVDKDVKRLALVKAQSIGCRETTLRAHGTMLGPRPGFRLAIDERPDDLDEEWLAVEVEHAVTVSATTPEVARLTGLSATRVYQMKLFAIPASVQYRAPQTTPWPRIYGFENGLVMGEADSPYAQIDTDGRYLVRFEFDTSDLPDAKVSTRVRMMQPHGGSTEGFHFPLRKGTEVMIAFLGGDCDRPFIAGVVPNAHKPSVVGQRNYTQNVIRTGSNNQIVMEDAQGKEFIFMHSPNMKTGIYLGHPVGDQSKIYTGENEQPTSANFTNPGAAYDGNTNATTDVSVSLWQTTDGNAGLWVGGDYWTNVWGKLNTFVYSDANIGYLGNHNFDVKGNSVEHYKSQRRTFVSTGRINIVSGGGETHEVTDHLYQTIHGDGYSHVEGGWEHHVDANDRDHYGSWTSDIDHDWNATVGGGWTGSFSNGSVKLSAKGGTFKLHADSAINMDAPSAKVKATGNILFEIAGVSVEKSSAKHEFYTYKGASGIVKTDHAGIYQSLYGVKIDTTLVKIETFPLKKKTLGVELKDAATGNKTGLLDLAATATQIRNFVFRKQ